MVSGPQKAGKWLVSGDIYTPLTNFCFKKKLYQLPGMHGFQVPALLEKYVFLFKSGGIVFRGGNDE